MTNSQSIQEDLPQPPAIPGYTWRPARREDAHAMNRMLLDIEDVDQRGMVDTLENRYRDFDDPDTNFETDSLLAVTDHGEIAALGWLFSPPNSEMEALSFLWGEEHPQHRQKGLGDFLLSWMEARGRQILAARPPDMPHNLRFHILDRLHEWIGLLQAHDFKHVRSFYRMRRDLAEPILEPLLPDGLRLAPYSRAIDRQVFEAFNASFRDHWGFIPSSYELWVLWITEHEDFRPDLSFVIFNEGNQVVGFSVNKVHQAENQAKGKLEAWIQDLGVLRDWRKRGLATALLCASMGAFRQAGFETAGLGVDAESLTGALRLYERLGFQVFSRSMAFLKKVN